MLRKATARVAIASPFLCLCGVIGWLTCWQAGVVLLIAILLCALMVLAFFWGIDNC